MKGEYKDIVDIFSVIATLVVAVVSLFISIVALKISRKIYIFSSKDYSPEIEYSIGDNDELTIINKSKDLFKIKSLNFIKIETIGFENYQNKTITEIPFITRSTLWWWIDDSQKIFLTKDDAGACAYQICPYDRKIVKAVYDRVHELYSMDSKIGYATPGLQGLKYIIDIDFENSFQDRKSVVFVKEHFHGTGFQSFRISSEKLVKIVNWSNIPKFKNFEELWKHLISTYSYAS